MLRRGEPTPRHDGRRGEIPTSPFQSSFEQRPMDPFPGSDMFPYREDPMNNTANPVESLSTEERTAETARLEQIAADTQERLEQLRRDNDNAEARPSKAASNRGESNGLRIAKKVVGWTLGAGVVLLGGAFLYSRFQGAEEAVDAAVDAVA